MVKTHKGLESEGGVINPLSPVYKRDLSDLVKEIADSISIEIIADVKSGGPIKYPAIWRLHARSLYMLSLKLDPKNREAKKALHRLEKYADYFSGPSGYPEGPVSGCGL